MTLDDALDRAIATDQTIAIADYEVRKARVEQLRAFTRILPSLSAGADATWRGDRTKEIVEIEEPIPVPPVPSAPSPPAAGNGTTGGAVTAPVTPPVTAPVRISRVARWSRSRSDQQSAGIDFSQPILDLTLGPARRQGEIGRQITEWQLRQQVREVLFGVAQQFIEVIKQERLVEEGRKTLGLTSEQVRQAEARLEAEEVIESDVLLARVDHERARRAVIESENSLALARTRLGITLNLGLGMPFLLIEPAKGRLAAPDIAQAAEVARSRREEVRIAHLTMSRTWAERDEIKARLRADGRFSMEPGHRDRVVLRAPDGMDGGIFAQLAAF